MKWVDLEVHVEVRNEALRARSTHGTGLMVQEPLQDAAFAEGVTLAAPRGRNPF